MVFATTPDKWIFLFTPSWQSVTSARTVYSEKCHIFLFEKHVHIYTTQSTTWQSEANWSRWPLLNRITGDHTSLFIGHKAKHICFHSAGFPCKDLNRDSSPISVVPSAFFSNRPSDQTSSSPASTPSAQPPSCQVAR